MMTFLQFLQGLQYTESDRETVLQLVTQDHISVPVSDTLSFVITSFWSERIWPAIYNPSQKTGNSKVCHKPDSKCVD